MRDTHQATPQILESIPPSLLALPKPPKTLFYLGDVNLLSAPIKIAIVGTRHPNPYVKQFCAILASKIAKAGGVVVSGGALGVDIIAHANALPRTIMLSPSSLEIIYPKTNKVIIQAMMNQSLVLSEYERGYMPKAHSFLERNRLVVGISDMIIIPQADLESGSMCSARFCLESHKPLFVLPHRINESLGTQSLLAKGQAQCIYDVEAFITQVFGRQAEEYDEVLEFCKNAPRFEEALQKFGDRIFEYELEGKIMRENGVVRIC